MAAAHGLPRTISQGNRTWLCGAASLIVLCATLVWLGQEEEGAWGVVAAFFIFLTAAFTLLVRKFGLWGAAAFAVLYGLLVWFGFGPLAHGGAVDLSLLFLLVACILLVLLFPVSFIFYLTASHYVFQRRDGLGCINCIALGGSLGLLNGALQSFMGWELSRELGLFFPGAQGALLGGVFFLLYRFKRCEKENG